MTLIRFPQIIIIECARLGTIRTVGIKAYGGDITDSTENPNTQFLNWETLSPGAEANCSFYIRSNSNQNIALNPTRQTVIQHQSQTS